MKLILLYLAVVLCTVCKATSVRGRAGLGTYSRFGLGVLLSGKKTLSAKNSGGNKDDSVSAGGKENSNDALRLGLDGAASVNTNLDASATHRVGGSGSSTTPQKDERSPFDLIKAILRLQGATSGSSKLSVHSTNDPSAEPGDDPTAQGPQATASSTPKQNVDTNLSSAGSATSNDGAPTPREQSSADSLLEESQNLGNESPTEASGSADKPTAHSGKENSNDALRLGLDGAASVNTNLDASATHRVGRSGSSTTPQKDERSPFDLIKAILRLQGSGKGGSSAETGSSRGRGRGSGATSGSSKLSVHSTNDPSAEPGDDPTAQGPQATASSTPKQNVDTNLSSAGSATSNDGASPAREQSSADPLMEESQNLGNESPTETSGSEDSSNEENLKKVLKAFADRIPQSSTGSSDSADRPNAYSGNSFSGELERIFDSNPTKASGTGKENSNDALRLGLDGAASVNTNLDASATHHVGRSGSSTTPQKDERSLFDLIKAILRLQGSGKGGSSAETGSSRGRGRGSGNGLMLQDQPAPASGRNDKTVDTSGLSTESAISNEENLSGSGDSNKVSGPSSSAVVSTDSGDDGNLEDKQVPRFNGDERDGENNSDFFGAGSLDTGNTSDSGSHNLSSGSGSSVRSNVSIGAGPSDQNESADLGGSGRVTCAGKTVSGASSVA
uniref:Submandibular gland protein C n=1 Tax=Rattus norvegicus TaxID=10116 RepID=Q6JHY3_RAT|nr:submandibular gland protein C precursor [Rattus norvegicus]|eukprot:NP_001004449.1 submandibular gland protein C precursor [Rattus norvegicus]